jgi:hypothetical protein
MNKWRIPTKNDDFLVNNAGRMFELLSGVDHHPPGYPINEKLRKDIQDFFGEAIEDGIDTIAVSECGLKQTEYTFIDRLKILGLAPGFIAIISVYILVWFVWKAFHG